MWNSLIGSPRTTLGGLVVLGALGMMWTHAIDLKSFTEIMAIAAVWIGISAKDGGK